MLKSVHQNDVENDPSSFYSTQLSNNHSSWPGHLTKWIEPLFPTAW